MNFCEKMENLVSSRSYLQSVPESYKVPPERRPGHEEVPLCETLPVINLGEGLCFDQAKLVKQIMHACQEFGFFQLINHGIPEKLMHDALDVVDEFFELPAEDKASIYSDDPKQSCRLYTSINYQKEKIHYWRDALRHPCHPLKERMQFWPEKPARYREVVGSYAAEVRRLSLQLLDSICEGLGLESGFFGDEFSQVQLMVMNHYSSCPDPSLTLGLPKHTDPNVITLLLQGEVPGLQVLKDEQWLGVKPLPNAFVVNIGDALQVISNGKLRSVEHRAVTNKSLSRKSIASFISSSANCNIGPAKALLSDYVPPLYKNFVFKDFLSTIPEDNREGIRSLERYKIHY